MEVPPPSVPDSRLTDWRRTDRTVDSPFSTPIVTVHTHTYVYEEQAQRERIREATGVDQAWRFFFTSRIRLKPSQPPSPMLTALIRRKVATAFADRLADRGFESIRERGHRTVSVGGNRATQYRYEARCHLTVPSGDVGDDGAEKTSTEVTSTEVTSPDETSAEEASGKKTTDSLALPVEGYLAVWHDDDYRIAGGAHPAGRATTGPSKLVATLSETIDPKAAKKELLSLIDGCSQ